MNPGCHRALPGPCRGTWSHRALPILLIATALLAGGCRDDSAIMPPGPTGSYTAPPLPARAQSEQSHAPTPAPEQCGDVTASLRPSADATGPALTAIRARGRLLVGLDGGSNLFSFRDPLTGALTGFDVDIAREIARDLFGSPDRIEFRILSAADREAALQQHTVDLVVKTMTITCERRRNVTFSTTYLLAHQRILVLRSSAVTGLPGLAGKRVCVVAGTTSLERIHREQPATSVLTVPTWSDCLVVLQQGQVDAVSTDDVLLAGLAVQDPYTRMVGPNLSEEPYGVGIPLGADDLVRFVNHTLDRLRTDGGWERLYQRWLVSLGPSPGPPPPSYRD
ncbi:glutamate ABC transporter substrate-binding protein [Nocardia sp. alder85J]|uniref:glutamate ABC transporter substrate-binding protein n=1 Tax=Nocardia sp. alder85J TaxID=2862949 RepID=UPI001CD1F9F9|nr:glutamate ABC transporter substrate-binding protein [Nocardia sp. alder85J]MCX4098951.1 glutamate ABC transporter substrate-binding protein [Nocardia sp. alder85J]